MIKCKDCGGQFDSKFCPDCGLSAKLERIDSRYFSKEIQGLFNVEKGFFYTVKEMLIRPGESIRKFLLEDRRKHVKPIVFLIFTSIIFTLFAYLLGIEYSYFNINNVQGLKEHVNTGILGEWLNKNIGYTNLTMGFFIALWVKVFFKKYDYSFYEIIVMLCFILGEATLLLSLTFIIGSATNSAIIPLLFMLLFLFYIIWAIGQFFDKKKVKSYVKAFLILLLGNISYILVLTLVGFINKSLF